jgi:hypothetical protein
MRGTTKVLLFCVLAPFLVSCGTQKDVAAADDAVTQFHKQLDNEDYATIYNQADERFRSATKQDDFLALMAAIHKKLGRTESATRRGFFVNFTTSGTQIRLTYATRFGAGDAQEQFVWSKNGENVALVGYNINSNALIVK